MHSCEIVRMLVSCRRPDAAACECAAMPAVRGGRSLGAGYTHARLFSGALLIAPLFSGGSGLHWTDLNSLRGRLARIKSQGAGCFAVKCRVMKCCSSSGGAASWTCQYLPCPPPITARLQEFSQPAAKHNSPLLLQVHGQSTQQVTGRVMG